MSKPLIALTIAALAASCITLSSAQAATQSKRIDLNTAEGATLAQRRIQCGSVDNTPTVYSFHGEAFARVPGERDRKLFDVEGYNIRQCVTVTDPVRGTGWRLVSRELLLYVDPATGELLKEWKNPWSGQTVKVLQTANDPVNQRPVFPIGADGKPNAWPATISGDTWWYTITVPLFYVNPLGGGYQKNVGGYYHATEMFNFFGKVSSIADPKIPNPPIEVGWVRMADWLPWMEMSGRAGLIYMHAAGRKLENYDQLPELMKKTIASDYPEYRTPPVGSDTRENETSWTYFKKKVEPTTPVKK
ncbi:MAG: DUF1838 domain-containing protein [Gammaproteobacteria bacterium]|nr:DUF1838 domain-containing protein [Gammaproteobacteria bacterium]